MHKPNANTTSVRTVVINNNLTNCNVFYSIYQPCLFSPQTTRPRNMMDDTECGDWILRTRDRPQHWAGSLHCFFFNARIGTARVYRMPDGSVGTRRRIVCVCTGPSWMHCVPVLACRSLLVSIVKKKQSSNDEKSATF